MIAHEQADHDGADEPIREKASTEETPDRRRSAMGEDHESLEAFDAARHSSGFAAGLIGRLRDGRETTRKFDRQK